MEQHPKRRLSGNRAAKQETDMDAPGSAAARTAPQARADGDRVGAQGSGAPPSNTAPDNCNGDYFKALRWGIDSLYLSFQGELNPDVQRRLKALKAMAQDQSPELQNAAQYVVGAHTFQVKDKGAALFPYVLDNAAFRIQVSRGGKLPMAYVKVSAAYLAHKKPAAIIAELEAMLGGFGLLAGTQISRLDLFADFVWPGSFDWPRESWVTRANGIDSYSENGIFTGWVVGRGGIMLARLYYKLLQAAKVGADYLLALWSEAGWQAGEEVWRLEFQIKRDVLVQMGLHSPAAVLDNLDGLWSYAMADWLRLTIPQADDKTRSRWPIHPLWGYLSAVDWQGDGGALTRSFKADYAPNDAKLYAMALSALVGFMAKRSMSDCYDANKLLLAETMSHFMRKAYKDGLSFDQYLAERIAAKVRQWGTAVNDPERVDAQLARDADEVAVRAAAYRKASRG